MIKRAFLLVTLFAFVFLASGCVTVYTDGCCPDKKAAPKKASKAENEEPNIVKKADNWVKDNLW
ncbi:MAG TPA: hypothetical protein PL125_03195 [Candidatus Omnitrophota bacterium]|nr:hypothetical protein [Candidatus Omnitrophota bacterium]HPT39186.1 hypothetical protein [Candidatus Omnitrophota bacterium]